MSQNQIGGQLALITGASGGIGGACAYQLGQQGVNLALTYSTNLSSMNDLVADLQSQYATNKLHISIYRVNLSSPDQIEAMFQQIDTQHGRQPDILISNAGYGKRVPDVWDISLKEFDYILNVNIRLSLILVKGVVEYMKSQ
ncbi:hypothetical protein AnigIFM60653_009926 [Aspergillus niger]|nr:hypothetical protein AnigIFM50267_011804 [Aspergillus niger]GLA08395.1 hypothetical protein AnigIFM60653_009926 [Aspergillus niger]